MTRHHVAQALVGIGLVAMVGAAWWIDPVVGLVASGSAGIVMGILLELTAQAAADAEEGE